MKMDPMKGATKVLYSKEISDATSQCYHTRSDVCEIWNVGYRFRNSLNTATTIDQETNTSGSSDNECLRSPPPSLYTKSITEEIKDKTPRCTPETSARPIKRSNWYKECCTSTTDEDEDDELAIQELKSDAKVKEKENIPPGTGTEDVNKNKEKTEDDEAYKNCLLEPVPYVPGEIRVPHQIQDFLPWDPEAMTFSPPGGCPAPFDLTRLYEFRQNLVPGCAIFPLCAPNEKAQDPNDKFLPNYPLLLIVVDSTVHYANLPYTMAINNTWVQGAAHIPMAQHVCICLDNGHKRYEAVFRIDIMRTDIEKINQDQVITECSNQYEIVEFRVMKSNPCRKPNFRSMLRKSIDEIVTPFICPTSHFEFVLGRPTGRNLELDGLTYRFMVEENGPYQSYFYPMIENHVQPIRMKLPGAAYYLTGYFFRPFFIASAMLTVNGKMQMIETIDYRVLFEKRRMVGMAYNSTIGRSYINGSQQGVEILAHGTYIDAGIPHWDNFGRNYIPALPNECHPFQAIDQNPCFNPGYNPYYSPMFNVPPVIFSAQQMEIAQQEFYGNQGVQYHQDPYMINNVGQFGFGLPQQPYELNPMPQQHQLMPPPGLPQLQEGNEMAFVQSDERSSTITTSCSSSVVSDSSRQTVEQYARGDQQTVQSASQSDEEKDFLPQGDGESITGSTASSIGEITPRSNASRFNPEAQPFYPKRMHGFNEAAAEFLPMSAVAHKVNYGPPGSPIVPPVTVANVGPLSLSIAEDLNESETELFDTPDEMN